MLDIHRLRRISKDAQKFQGIDLALAKYVEKLCELEAEKGYYCAIIDKLHIESANLLSNYFYLQGYTVKINPGSLTISWQ